MPSTPIGWVHFIIAILAMVVGAAVALLAKGTPQHRWAGLGYAWLLLGVNLTAFMLYGLFGRLGPFHVAAAVSLATVLAGWLPARTRRSGWVFRHAQFMSWSSNPKGR